MVIGCITGSVVVVTRITRRQWGLVIMARCVKCNLELMVLPRFRGGYRLEWFCCACNVWGIDGDDAGVVGACISPGEVDTVS